MFKTSGKMAPPMGSLNGGLHDGPNMRHVQRTGTSTPITMMTKSLTKEAFLTMMQKHSSTGNIRTILEKKEIVNDVLTVFIGDEESLVFTPAGLAYNLSYAHPIQAKHLYDQIQVVIVTPAPVAHENIHPVTYATFMVEHNFSKITRQSNMFIQGGVMDTIEKLRTQIADFDVMVGDQSSQANVKDSIAGQEKLQEFSNNIITQLEDCFKEPAYLMKKSIEKGVVDQAIMSIVERSTPLALAWVARNMASSIADGASPFDWEHNQVLIRNMAREYVAASCRSMYSLMKNPSNFLDEFIQCGIETVQKIATLKTDAIVYNIETKVVYPLDGIILIGHQAFRFLMKSNGGLGDDGRGVGAKLGEGGVQSLGMGPGIQPPKLWKGKVVHKKPAFFKPFDNLSAGDATRNVTMMYDKNEGDLGREKKTSEGLEELLRTVKEDDTFPISRRKGTGVVSLSELGQKLLAGQTTEDSPSTRESNRERFLLATYDVVFDCMFYIHGGKAYVIEPARQYMPTNDVPDYYQRSPSLVSHKHNLFRVSVGDLDFNNDYTTRYMNRLKGVEGRVNTQQEEQQQPPNIAPSSSGIAGTGSEIDQGRLFITKPVFVYTPGLSPQKLKFDSNEIRTAFMDPMLYSAKSQEEALRENLIALNRNPSSQNDFLKNIFDKQIEVASKRKIIYKKYYKDTSSMLNTNSDGHRAKHLLQSIELSPFFQAKSSMNRVTEKEQIDLEKRDMYHQMPLLQMDVIKTRGLCMLTKAFSDGSAALLENDLKYLQKIFTITRDNPTDIPHLPNDIKPDQDGKPNAKMLLSIADRLAEGFIRSFVREPFKPEQINFLFNVAHLANGNDDNNFPRHWFIMKYVIMPIIAEGKVRFQNTESTLNDKTYTLTGEIMARTNNAMENTFSMFDNDKVFQNKDVFIMSAVTNFVCVKSQWPLAVKACALFMQFCLTTPTAMTAMILENVNTGFAVDFIKEENMYSEQAVFTKPGAFEMILSPAGAQVVENADSSVKVDVSCDIMSVRNTLGAGALIAPTIFPNINAAPGGETIAGSPIISNDNITRSIQGNLDTIFAQDPDAFSDQDKEYIRRQITNNAQNRAAYGRAFSHTTSSRRQRNPGLAEHFVAIIRPIRAPTEETVPIMGVDTPLIPLGGSRASAWSQMYTAEDETLNSYASKLGSIYQMRYTANNTAIGENRNFLLRTTCENESTISSYTTEIMMGIYDFNMPRDIMSKHDRSYISVDTSRNYLSSEGMVFKDERDEVGDVRSKRLDELDVPTILGHAMPYTQSTDPQRLKDSLNCIHPNAGQTVQLKGPNDYIIISPATVPPIKNIC